MSGREPSGPRRADRVGRLCESASELSRVLECVLRCEGDLRKQLGGDDASGLLEELAAGLDGMRESLEGMLGMLPPEGALADPGVTAGGDNGASLALGGLGVSAEYSAGMPPGSAVPLPAVIPIQPTRSAASPTLRTRECIFSDEDDLFLAGRESDLFKVYSVYSSGDGARPSLLVSQILRMFSACGASQAAGLLPSSSVVSSVYKQYVDASQRVSFDSFLLGLYELCPGPNEFREVVSLLSAAPTEPPPEVDMSVASLFPEGAPRAPGSSAAELEADLGIEEGRSEPRREAGRVAGSAAGSAMGCVAVGTPGRPCRTPVPAASPLSSPLALSAGPATPSGPCAPARTAIPASKLSASSFLWPQTVSQEDLEVIRYFSGLFDGKYSDILIRRINPVVKLPGQEAYKLRHNLSYVYDRMARRKGDIRYVTVADCLAWLTAVMRQSGLSRRVLAAIVRESLDLVVEGQRAMDNYGFARVIFVAALTMFEFGEREGEAVRPAAGSRLVAADPDDPLTRTPRRSRSGGIERSARPSDGVLTASGRRAPVELVGVEERVMRLVVLITRDW